MIKELIDELLDLKDKQYLRQVSILTENLYLDVNKALEANILDEIIKYETVKSLQIKVSTKTIIDKKVNKLVYLLESKYKDIIVSVVQDTQLHPENLTIHLTK